MRKLFNIFGIFSILVLSSCEEIISIEIPSANPNVVVEAFLTNEPQSQIIRLRESQNYFDESNPKPITGAEVSVQDNHGHNYTFIEDSLGKYVWNPSQEVPVIGQAGSSFTLKVRWNSEEFQAFSTMNRVPTLDSIAYKFIENSFAPEGKPKEGYEAQFFAKDFVGQGDCYRVRFYKNGKRFNTTQNIIVTYDANFQKGPQGDGLVFILPIRKAISPELYLENDELKVEILSITENEFNFWSQAILEINNAGLFARPTANIPTNFVNKNAQSNWQGAGWFSTSAVSSKTVTIDPAKANPKLVN